MDIILTVVHIFASFLLIVVVLLQSGRGGGLGAGFGGAGQATQLFGGRGAGSLLSRSTVALAVTFMLTSLGLAFISSRPQSAMDLGAKSDIQTNVEDEVVEEGTLPELPPAPKEGEEGTANPTTTPDNPAIKKVEPPNLPIKVNPVNNGTTGDEAATNSPTTGTDDAAVDDKTVDDKTADDKTADDKTADDTVADDKAEQPKPDAAPKADDAKPKAEPKPEPKPETKPEPKADDKPKAEPKPATPDKAKPDAATKTDEAAP